MIRKNLLLPAATAEARPCRKTTASCVLFLTVNRMKPFLAFSAVVAAALALGLVVYFGNMTDGSSTPVPGLSTAPGKPIGRPTPEPSPEPTPTELTTGETCEDTCGDGQCAEIVCLAIGCPCAETPESCPADCK